MNDSSSVLRHCRRTIFLWLRKPASLLSTNHGDIEEQRQDLRIKVA
jgi:hypothetical protein